MTDIASRIATSIAASFTKDFIVLVFSGGLSAFVTGYLSDKFRLDIWAQLGTLLIIIGFIFIVFRKLWKTFNKNIPDIPKIISSYSINHRSIVHDVSRESKVIHRRSWNLKSTSRNLRRFTDSFRWTGDGVANIVCKNASYSVKIEEPHQDEYVFYQIDFNKFIKKNQSISFEVEWNLQGQGKPFISTNILDRTDKLEMTVVFGRDSGIREVICEVFPHPQWVEPEETTTLSVGDEGVVKWIVDNPKLMWHYQMRWPHVDKSYPSVVTP
ncbi:MAG: hypothetical protein IAE99_02655 [Rhodothermales bacterium]|nr:hypothetical protein [Rhodothermales bacterium]